MEKNIIITVFVLLLSSKAMLGQTSLVFGMKSDFTRRHMRMNKETPFIYNVKRVKEIQTIQTKVKVVSNEYKRLKESIIVIEDQINQNTIEQKIGEGRYNDLAEVVSNIESFLKSQKPFQLKKDLLKQTQKLLEKHEIDQLVYADQKFNTQYDTKFRMLSSNAISFKMHLNKIKSRLNVLNVKSRLNILDKKSSKSRDIKKLNLLKEKIKSTDPYTFINGALDKKENIKLVIGKKLDCASTLNGDFVFLNDYYIVLQDYKNLRRGELITKEEARELNLIRTSIIKNKAKKLIKNKALGKTYLVDQSFLKKYTYTFNGRYRYQVRSLINSLSHNDLEY